MPDNIGIRTIHSTKPLESREERERLAMSFVNSVKHSGSSAKRPQNDSFSRITSAALHEKKYQVASFIFFVPSMAWLSSLGEISRDSIWFHLGFACTLCLVFALVPGCYLDLRRRWDAPGSKRGWILMLAGGLLFFWGFSVIFFSYFLRGQ